MNPVRHTASPEQAFTLVEILVRIGIIILATLVTVRLVYLLIGRIERAIRSEAKGTELAREKRARTIGEVLRGFSRGIIIVIGILMCVRELGLDITPALAAAGGFGVAAGLGAQSVVKDWIAGFFIIHDNQFAVGDVVRTMGVSGTVETLTLRHTELRDGEGFIHFISNGEIKVVTNLTKSWSTPIVRIPISLTEDPARVVQVLEAMLVRFAASPNAKPLLLEPPRLLGIDDVGTGQFTIMLQAKTVPEERLAVSRMLRMAALESLRAAGVLVHVPVAGDAPAAVQQAAPADAPAQAATSSGDAA
ncbi:MAG TPA: mechanosensitive ion channel family protein [Candidatus Eisenbacteria bacterium]|nr:mechanosensitive ion channel family protein [Candidatus Eisenbacteria bacterium]